jgi:hypothetical protein
MHLAVFIAEMPDDIFFKVGMISGTLPAIFFVPAFFMARPVSLRAFLRLKKVCRVN